MRFAVISSLVLCAVSIAVPLQVQARDQARGNDAPALGYLGVAIVPVNEQIAQSLGMPDIKGVLVYDVQDGSPAAKAGLRPNDVVLRFDGVDVDESTDLGSLVGRTRPNHKAQLTVLRNGAAMRITAIVGSRPDLLAVPTASLSLPPGGFAPLEMPTTALRWQCRRFGIEYETVDSQLAEFFGLKQGVLLRFVAPHSIADRAGLKAGDVVTRFNGKEVDDARDLTVILQQGGLPKNVPIDVIRDHKRQSATLASAGMLP